MPESSLADFIDRERGQIVREWERFARTIAPAAEQSGQTLRDHADEILTAIVHDMRSKQSADEQAEKSKGHGEAQNLGTIGKVHATVRMDHGFKLVQIVAEFRALRASVHRLWKGGDTGGVTRFNEAIDEALSESVGRFVETSDRFRDHSIGILGHDLRDPLGAVIMGAENLRRSSHLDESERRTASRILKSATRMNRMVADLLDLTRTRFGNLIPVRRVPSISEPSVAK